MGFFIMILSAFIGVILGGFGIARRKNHLQAALLISGGLILLGFAVWLGLPR